MQILRALCDFILPPRCVVCEASTSGASDPWVCAGCWTAVEFVRPPVCAQCGAPFAAPAEGIGSAAHRCGKCLLSPPPYERARAVGLYEGTLREVIHYAVESVMSRYLVRYPIPNSVEIREAT